MPVKQALGVSLYRGLADHERAEWESSGSLTLRPSEPLALSIDEAQFCLVTGEDQRIVEHVLEKKRRCVSLTTDRLIAAHFGARESTTTFRSRPGMVATIDFPICPDAARGDGIDRPAFRWNEHILLASPAELATTANAEAMVDVFEKSNVDSEILLVIGELAVKQVEIVAYSGPAHIGDATCRRCIYEAWSNPTYPRCPA